MSPRAQSGSLHLTYLFLSAFSQFIFTLLQLEDPSGFLLLSRHIRSSPLLGLLTLLGDLRLSLCLNLSRQLGLFGLSPSFGFLCGSLSLGLFFSTAPQFFLLLLSCRLCLLLASLELDLLLFFLLPLPLRSPFLFGFLLLLFLHKFVQFELLLQQFHVFFVLISLLQQE